MAEWGRLPTSGFHQVNCENKTSEKLHINSLQPPLEDRVMVTPPFQSICQPCGGGLPSAQRPWHTGPAGAGGPAPCSPAPGGMKGRCPPGARGTEELSSGHGQNSTPRSFLSGSTRFKTNWRCQQAGLGRRSGRGGVSRRSPAHCAFRPATFPPPGGRVRAGGGQYVLWGPGNPGTQFSAGAG